MFLLGDAFSLEEKRRNSEFYDPLTTGDSSLSSCIEAIVAAQVGDTDKAISYGMAALLMDLADVGGSVKDRCHIASMGGPWMMLAYGLGGLRDDDGMLSLWPRRAPEDSAVLRFPLTWRGQRLEVEIGMGTAEYTLCQGEALLIRHEMEVIRLTHGRGPHDRSAGGRPEHQRLGYQASSAVRIDCARSPRRYGFRISGTSGRLLPGRCTLA